MKSIVLISAILLFSYAAWGQIKRFTLLDTNVTVGQTYLTRQIQVEFKSGNFPCHDSLLPQSFIVLDSIFIFMIKNRNLVIEVGVNDDLYFLGDHCDNIVTQQRALKIVSYLVKKGVATQRLIAKGYGQRYLRVTEEQIKKAKTKEEKEALHTLNRSLVLKVVDKMR